MPAVGVPRVPAQGAIARQGWSIVRREPAGKAGSTSRGTRPIITDQRSPRPLWTTHRMWPPATEPTYCGVTSRIGIGSVATER